MLKVKNMVETDAGFDVIPNIHGDIERLQRTLAKLGYENLPEGWRHPDGRPGASSVEHRTLP
jgi:hypothetical protein